MDLDEVYLEIGEFGRQQKIYFFLLSMFNLYAPFVLIQTVFIAQTPSFTCYSNGISFNDTCRDNRLKSCDRIVYNENPDSAIKQWGLICDDAYVVKFIQSVFMAGIGCGAVVCGYLADKFGRKRVLAASLMGMIVFGILSSFMHKFGLYLLMRFIAGVFTAGNIVACFVLATELVGPSKRGFCGILFMMFFSVGIVLYATLAYYVRNWRALTISANCVGIPFFLFFLLLPESPRWLLTHDRPLDARNVLRKIAARNEKPFPSETEIFVPIPDVNHGSFLDMFKSRKTAISTLIQMFSWFTNSCVYYGLTLASEGLGSNVYTTTMLSGVVEIPALILSTILIDGVGRRIPLSGFMIVGGVSCFMIRFVENSDIVFSLALIGKLSIAASFSIIYIHSAELFPTTQRSAGIGLCSMCARLGGILSPFISLLNVWRPSAQFTVFGLLIMTSGLLNLMLAETVNRSLPETMEDLNTDASLRNERSRYSRLGDFEGLNETDDEEEDLFAKGASFGQPSSAILT